MLNILNRIASFLIAGALSWSAVAAQTETPYTTYSRYDERGVLLGTISPSSPGYLASRNTYDASGALVKTEIGKLSNWQNESVKPANWTGFIRSSSQVIAYDNYGRKATVTRFDKAGTAISLTQTNYDAQSRVFCQAERMNPAAYASLPDACIPGTEGTQGPDRITRYAYDELDQPLTIVKSYGTSLSQTYVTNTYVGTYLTSQTDANGNRTELFYDTNQRLERVVYPSPTASGTINSNDYVHFEYDADGNKIVERKRNNTWIDYTVDANNRVIVKNYRDNTKQQDVVFDYDARGLLRSSIFNSGAVVGQGLTNTFDGFGRLSTAISTMGGVNRVLTYVYDNSGNRTRITHPDQSSFTYSFDNLNRISSLNEGDNTNLLSIKYNDIGRRKTIQRQGGAATLYNFDDGVHLTGFSQTFSDISKHLTNNFTYNAANQISTLSLGNPAYYYYSGNENRTGNYVVNGLNQYASVAGQALTYDANGNLTSDGLSNSFTYDDENRLVSASVNGQAASLKYDPNGRLFETVIGGTSTQFLYDGDALVAEYRSGVIQNRYVHGDQVDEPLVQYSGSTLTNRRYLHADHQGSIIALSDSTGNQTNSLAYDSYGIPSAANTGRFGYTGQIWLKELGLFHYKARVYSPKLGRFLQTDPIGYKDDMDLYTYVGNDPVNKTDPTGTMQIFTKAMVEIFKQSAKKSAQEAAKQEAKQVAKEAAKQEAKTEVKQEAKQEAKQETKEVISRKAPGGDGAKSEQTIKRENGEVVSRTHTVTKDGEVIHQHENSIGKAGGERQFPDEWTGTKTINAPYENHPPQFGPNQ